MRLTSKQKSSYKNIIIRYRTTMSKVVTPKQKVSITYAALNFFRELFSNYDTFNEDLVIYFRRELEPALNNVWNEKNLDDYLTNLDNFCARTAKEL